MVLKVAGWFCLLFESTAIVEVLTGNAGVALLPIIKTKR